MIVNKIDELIDDAVKKYSIMLILQTASLKCKTKDFSEMRTKACADYDNAIKLIIECENDK